jgi:glycine/D-amino acid oxidase-like deaminating enzyme
VEPGLSTGSPEALAELRHLGGRGPDWLREAEPLRHWQGLRARPDDSPAPLLEQLEPGLLLTSGHYRNGVLLAPATAAWVLQQLGEPGA